MATSCNLIGKTERQTMLSELGWTADWATTLLRHLRMAYMSMLHTASMAGPNVEYGESGPDMATVDAMVTNLRGALAAIEKKFDMHLYMGEEGFPVWKNLEHNFDEMKKQGQGIIPIPVDKDERQPELNKKEISESDKNAFTDVIKRFITIQAELQDLLKRNYKCGAGAVTPFARIRLEFVDCNGRELKLVDLPDVEEIVAKAMMERVDRPSQETQDAITPKADVPKDWNPGVPPSVPSKKKKGK